MRSKLGLVLALLVTLATSALADFGRLYFPGAGDREVWFAMGLPTEAPTVSIKTKASEVEIDLAGKKENESVFVADRKSGNLASKQIKDVKSSWTLDAASFTDIAEVRVRVEAQGKPVDAAQVELKDTRRAVPQLLVPSMKGEVVFFAVKPGKLEVTVTYKSGGKDKKVQQVFELSLERSEAFPTLGVGIADKVDTVASPGASGKTTEPKPDATSSNPNATNAGAGAAGTPDEQPKSEKAPPVAPTSSPANPIGTIIVYLIGLGIIGASIYYALQVWKKNGDKLAPKLEQLGVQIPKPDDQQPDPSPAPIPITPAPVQKIVLDDAAPEPLGVVPPAPVMAGPKNPRIVAETGGEVVIEAGENIVGRELGLWLSLPSESTVSRKHATLVRNGDQVQVTDLGSTNGTYVNGAKLSGTVNLSRGDSVQFGAVRYRFEE